MQPIFNYIISTDKRYNNSVDVDGSELVVNTEITERDYHFVNRIGVVEKVSMFNNLSLEVGDEVIVHHNVFRRWYDQHGRERNSSSHLSDSRYAVYDDQIFGYKRNDGWVSVSGYVFLAPVEDDDKWSTELEKPHVGQLVYSNSKVDAEIGDIVGFTPDSEYEFNIDDQKLYRVLSNQITWKATRKNEKKLLPLQRSH